VEFAVYAEGYVFQTWQTSWDGVTPLEIGVRLVPPRTLATGTVTAAGSPVADVYVRSYKWSGTYWVPSWTAWTGSDGVYTLKEAESVHGTTGAGDYKFTTEVAGYHDQTVYEAWDGMTPLGIGFALVADAAPVGVADAYTTAKNTKLTIAAPGVLANDYDPEGDALTAVRMTNPSAGTLVFSANGSFTYTPQKNWTGTTTFTYRAYDGYAYSNTVTVTLTVKSTTGGGGRH
jgi:5-hydroxyisourate hydrolase-like protein (transthyretin family)